MDYPPTQDKSDAMIIRVKEEKFRWTLKFGSELVNSKKKPVAKSKAKDNTQKKTRASVESQHEARNKGERRLKTARHLLTDYVYVRKERYYALYYN